MGSAEQPVVPPALIADIAGGGMSAAIGILLALFAREKTGQGQYIDISMTDSMVSLLPVALLWQQLMGTFPERGNAMLSHRYACYNTYETADNRYITIGAVEDLQGISWTGIEISGQANHAGTTPMDDRRDALLAAFPAEQQERAAFEWIEQHGAAPYPT